MALVTPRPVLNGPEFDVLDTRDDDGVSVTVLGDKIQPFQAVVTDTTFADVHTHMSKAVPNMSLPINIPSGGGAIRIDLVEPIDQLLNPRSVRIKVGYTVHVKQADGTSRNVTEHDALVWNMDSYIVSKQTWMINNNQQFGTAVNRDYSDVSRRVRLLKEIRTDWYGSLMRLYDQAKYLNSKSGGRILDGLENFCTLETEGQGILESTNMFPGILTSLTGIIQIKPIFEMFSQENGTAGHNQLTNGIDTAYIRITSVYCEQQTILPSAPLWEALGNVATQGGGLAKTPSRYFVIRENRNISTKTGNEAYFSWPNVQKMSLAVPSQGRDAFHNTGTSPFSASTAGVISWHTYDALNPQQKIYYNEWFKETVLKNIAVASEWPLESYHNLIEDMRVWLRGNSFNCFSTSTAVSNQDDMKSPVYAAPLNVITTLNGGPTEATVQQIYGRSKGVLCISQNGAITENRWGSGTSSSSGLNILRGEAEAEEVESHE